MAYFEHYRAEFDSVSEETYRIYIYEKDYVGSIVNLTLSAIPIKHAWSTDEPQPPIKGSSLTFSYLNTGSVPISSFYSVNDDQFKIQLFRGGEMLFEGFLVQDDCAEIMVDYTHEITLSFNDNLGLLKDVPLDSNVPNLGAFTASAYFDFLSPSPSNNCFIYLYNTTFIPVVATPFTISGHIEAAANATWTPTAVTAIGNGNWKVQVADFSFIDMQAWPCFIAGSSTIDLYNRNSLLNIIRVCLYNTGLELDTHIYANIFEVSQDVTRSFLEQTYIDAQTFIEGESFMDCYRVLEIIMDRFNLTLFQANGVWNIVRWQEFRYYTSPFPLPYFIYDFEMTYTGTGTLDKFYTTGFEESIYPEVGLTRSIIRPYNFDKETYNYYQPKYLLRNFDLQDLGSLITSYVSGPNTISEYNLTDWHDAGFSPQPSYFIRVVVTTATGFEVERYVVVSGATGDNPRSVMSTPFEVSAGDKITFEYTFKTTKSQAGPGTVVLALRLYDLSTTNYADEDPTVNWKVGVGWNFTIPSGGNTNVNQTVTIDPGQIPFDGLIYCYLPQADQTAAGGDETQIKDIRITYTPYINDSVKINGQVHTSTQNVNIKNNESIEIFTDDSPRNSIKGTLFKPSFATSIQDKTSQWYRISNPSETLRIGEITTGEQLKWRQISRAKLEGTFYGLVQTNNVSMLAILTNTALPGLNFIFGMLEIDYRNNSFNGTQWEIYEDGESIAEPIVYDFKYLYSS